MLVVHLGDREWTRLVPPDDLGARAWLLAVVAVQLQGATGQVRAHLTGRADAQVHTLDAETIVHVTLGAGQLPGLPPAKPSTDAARIELFLDGAPLHDVGLARTSLGQLPTPRAFGHVFCRHLRNGDIEPGFDLTDFISQPPGSKYERVIQQPLDPGHTVSYRVHLRP